MSDTYITDIAKLITQLIRFTSFIQFLDESTGAISFRDSSGFLGREEDYKSRIAEDARKELQFSSWDESWIGTGRIAEYARKAISKSGNLVNKNQQVDFKNRLDPNHTKFKADAERVLYDIYCNPQCEDFESFTRAVQIFGAKYDTIAFLFFVKDDTHFLPISTGHFDKGFAELGINYITSYQCSWDNYIGFINIILEIRAVMEAMLPLKGTLRLIDAHSFVWVIQQERFIKWIPDTNQNMLIEQISEESIKRHT